MGWVLSEDASCGVLPPITAADLRGISAQPGSDRWFRRWAEFCWKALQQSTCSPLHPGRFVLERATAAFAKPGVRLHHAYGAVENTRRVLLREYGALDPWGLEGNGGIIPMRRASDASAARVKAWRKRALEGDLPPVLLYFIAPLDEYVVLDGHDRLVAAACEGIAPSLLTLTSVRRSVHMDKAGIPHAPQEDTPKHGLRADSSVSAGEDGWRDAKSFTRAWPLRGGCSVWDVQVQERLATLDAPVREHLAALVG